MSTIARTRFARPVLSLPVLATLGLPAAASAQTLMDQKPASARHERADRAIGGSDAAGLRTQARPGAGAVLGRLD